MEDRESIQYRYRPFLLTLLLLAGSTAFCLVRLLQIPGWDKNIFLLGMTAERFLMAAVFAVLGLLNLVSLICSKKLFSLLPNISAKKTGVVLGILTVILCFFTLLPAYRFHRKTAVYLRLKPFILCAFLYAFVLFHFLYLSRNPFSCRIREEIPVKTFRIALLVFLAAGLFIGITKIGITTESNLWNKNGIPLQGIQIYLSFWAAWLFRRFAPKKEQRRGLHFLIIWAAAALIWSFVPLNNQFFAPGPTEPNMEYYPYSDALAYDWSQVQAQNGWGFDNHKVILKPVVTIVSYVTHRLTGNDYNRAELLQSALYGILPAIIYLFGSAAGGTLCGWLAAAFSILREWNALNSTRVLTINSRVIMSEFAMQIIFAGFCLFCFKWLRNSEKRPCSCIGAGCMLALGIYTRYNFLIFLPAVFVIGIAAFRKNKAAFLKQFAVMLAAMLFVASPLLVRSYRITGKIYPEFTDTFSKVLLGQRYADSEMSADLPQESSASETQTDIPAAAETEVPADVKPGKMSKILFMGKSILNHTVHNLMAQLCTLPLGFDFDTPEHLFENEPGMPWNDAWDYHFSFVQWIFIVFWVLMFCTDIAFLWKHFGFAGLSPVWFWCIYAFSTGFSRSSGGRYIVPCNWIPCLFLALFIQIIFEHGKIEIRTESEKTDLTGAIPVTAFCFLLMISFSVIEAVTPARVIGTEGDEKEVILQTFGTDFDTPGQDLLYSKGLITYPTFYYYGKGGHTDYGPYQALDYSRLVFLGLNKGTQRDYMMAHEEFIPVFPNGAEFYAVSQKHPGDYYQDILAIVITTDSGEKITYTADGY